MKTTTIQHVYDEDDAYVGLIEVREGEPFVVRDADQEYVGTERSFNRALDLLGGFRWEAQ